MIWHSMKDLFNTGGSVCVTETPTGFNLCGDARKDLHADNFTCVVGPQLSTSMAKKTGEVCVFRVSAARLRFFLCKQRQMRIDWDSDLIRFDSWGCL